jgi:hypothetical protein
VNNLSLTMYQYVVERVVVQFTTVAVLFESNESNSEAFLREYKFESNESNSEA